MEWKGSGRNKEERRRKKRGGKDEKLKCHHQRSAEHNVDYTFRVLKTAAEMQKHFTKSVASIERTSLKAISLARIMVRM